MDIKDQWDIHDSILVLLPLLDDTNILKSLVRACDLYIEGGNENDQNI